MPELVLRLVQLGFLVVLWLFVLTAVRVVRADLLGQPGRAAASRPAPAARPLRADRPVKPARRARRSEAHRLVVVEGSLRGTTVQLADSPVTIGRADGATLVLADDYASSRHAELRPDGNGGWLVEDLGSTNGTFLDRERVTGPTAVRPGVPIRIGRTVMELRA